MPITRYIIHKLHRPLCLAMSMWLCMGMGLSGFSEKISIKQIPIGETVSLQSLMKTPASTPTPTPVKKKKISRKKITKAPRKKLASAMATPARIYQEGQPANQIMLSGTIELPLAEEDKGRATIDQDGLEIVSLYGMVEPVNELTLSPQKVISMVASDNIDVALAQNSINQSRWENFTTWSRALPSVRGEYFLEKYTGSTVILFQDPLEVRRVTHQNRLYLSYDAFTGVKTLFDGNISHNEVKRQRKGYDGTMQKTLLDSMRQYYLWQRDIAAERTARQALEEAIAQRAQAEIRCKNGFGTQLDVEQALVVEAERRQDLLRTQNQKQLSGLTLATLLNLPIDVSVHPETEELEPLDIWTSDASLPQLYDLAQQNRPEVQQLALMVKQAKTAYWSSVADVLPKVELSTFVGTVGPQKGDFKRAFQRGIRVNIDVLKYLGMETLGNTQISREKIKAAILTKEKELNRIQNDLAKAYYEFQFFKEQLAVAQKKVNSAQEAYRISDARQKRGIGIHLEVVTAQAKLAEAQQEYLSAIMNYNNAQLGLMYETGQLQADRILTSLNK